MSDLERFMQFVTKVETGRKCWLWIGGKNGSGYGSFRVSQARVEKSHRYMWELVHGSVPLDKQVLHECDTPLCVNPDHLFLGTQQDNILDGQLKGKYSKLLTPELVRKIRNMNDDGYSQVAIARDINCSRNTVDRVLKGKTYHYIT